MVTANGVDPMLHAHHLLDLGPDLVTALLSSNVEGFLHLEAN